MNSLISNLKLLRLNESGRLALKELPELIFQLDASGNFLDFFAMDESLLATPADSIIGNNLKGFFSEEMTLEAMKHLKLALQTKKVVVFEYSLLLNNSLQYFEAKIIPENEVSVTAFVRDITEIRKIKLNEKEHLRIIEESERRFRLLADHLPGAVYLCNNDANFSMMYLNDKVFDITGYRPEQFISKEINFPDIYYPEDTPEIYRQVEKSLAEQTSFHLEYRIRHQSGELRWIEEFGTGVFNNNELVCLEGYLQDITERKKVESKIRLQNEALIKTNEELDRFVYSASHDLRSPLSSVLGLLNLISESTSRDEILFLLDKMKDRVNALDYFIKEITYYSQNTRLEVELTEVSLLPIISESIDSLRHMEEAWELDFEVKVPPDLKLVTDLRRLKIILNNLISNAIKYHDYSKRNCWIQVRAEWKEKECLISISDNGIGIAAEYQPKIFNMFYRASEKSNGSGLGLYIVKETVEKIHGRIELSSLEGEGTTFIVRLPKISLD